MQVDTPGTMRGSAISTCLGARLPRSCNNFNAPILLCHFFSSARAPSRYYNSNVSLSVQRGCLLRKAQRNCALNAFCVQ